MKIREEIKRYSREEDKPILNWLFDRYHYSSNWPFVAFCQFEDKYPATKRIWAPKIEGIILYENRNKFKD